jgi:flagellar biosynthesis activator protein FlaF
MSLQAYQQASARAENPRDAEYRLFGQVTRALMAAADAGEHEHGVRMHALDWNRRLWSTLATDCSSSGNGLPAPVRAQIISLSLWVSRHTSLVMRRQDEIGALIDINRIIMQGLATRPDAA